MRIMLPRMVFLAGCCFLGLGFFFPAQASTKSYRSLTTTEKLALDESQQRLIILDHALQSLDDRFAHKKISHTDYAYEKHDLTAFISAEARFQNALLKKDDALISEGAREVLENIAKYTILVPAYALAILTRGLVSPPGASYSFSP
jgi:hypothetical protein